MPVPTSPHVRKRALTEKLCWHEDDYQAFIDSLGIYRNSSKVLADALDNPNHHNHNFLCSEIEQALRGMTPINPFQHSKPESTDNLKRDSFFNNLQSRMWELYGYYGKLSCKRWHGYPIGEAIDDLLYLSKQVAYLLPEDPNFKPYAGQQKGANTIKNQKQERDKKALELWRSKEWGSYTRFAKYNHEELRYTEKTLSREMPKILKRYETL